MGTGQETSVRCSSSGTPRESQAKTRVVGIWGKFDWDRVGIVEGCCGVSIRGKFVLSINLRYKTRVWYALD